MTKERSATEQRRTLALESRAGDQQALYLEAMEQLLPRIKKLIVDQNGNLDLTIIRKSDPPPSTK
jgi:hypothetical protein